MRRPFMTRSLPRDNPARCARLLRVVRFGTREACEEGEMTGTSELPVLRVPIQGTIPGTGPPGAALALAPGYRCLPRWCIWNETHRGQARSCAVLAGLNRHLPVGAIEAHVAAASQKSRTVSRPAF